MTEKDEISLRSCGGTNGAVYDSVLNHPELDYLFCVNKDFNCWLIPLEDVIKSGNVKTIISTISKSKVRYYYLSSSSLE